MLQIDPSARIAALADIEDSVRGSLIEIGPGVTIDSFVKIKPAGGSGDVRIGSGTTINSGVAIYTGNGVTIGRNCAIAANCTFAPVNHEIADPNRPITEQKFMTSRGGVVVEDDVWIGANAVLLDGAILRKGCVVGAGAVVRGEIPENAVCVGAPARVISFRGDAARASGGTMARRAKRTPKFTVFGGNGFIGRHVASALIARGHAVDIPPRGADPARLRDLGHVLYCAGLTADFRSRPYETMEAHVALPARLLEAHAFDSFLYLSSTRVYAGLSEGREDTVLTVDPASPGDLYNLSKLSGESLCLNEADTAVRVARLSNVFGCGMADPGATQDNFLASVVNSAAIDGEIRLATSPASAKDYLHIDDAVDALLLVALQGTERLYNVASGTNVTHEEIVKRLAALTGCTRHTERNAPITSYPEIRTDRLSAAFRTAGRVWRPARLTDRLAEMVDETRRTYPCAQGAVA